MFRRRLRAKLLETKRDIMKTKYELDNNIVPEPVSGMILTVLALISMMCSSIHSFMVLEDEREVIDAYRHLVDDDADEHDSSQPQSQLKKSTLQNLTQHSQPEKRKPPTQAYELAYLWHQSKSFLSSHKF